MRIDCHNHIIDPARFPYNPNAAYFPAGQEIAPVEQFLHVMDSHAITTTPTIPACSPPSLTRPRA